MQNKIIWALAETIVFYADRKEFMLCINMCSEKAENLYSLLLVICFFCIQMVINLLTFEIFG